CLDSSGVPALSWADQSKYSSSCSPLPNTVDSLKNRHQTVQLRTKMHRSCCISLHQSHLSTRPRFPLSKALSKRSSPIENTLCPGMLGEHSVFVLHRTSIAAASCNFHLRDLTNLPTY